MLTYQKLISDRSQHLTHQHISTSLTFVRFIITETKLVCLVNKKLSRCWDIVSCKPLDTILRAEFDGFEMQFRTFLIVGARRLRFSIKLPYYPTCSLLASFLRLLPLKCKTFSIPHSSSSIEFGITGYNDSGRLPNTDSIAESPFYPVITG